jgi:serine/threonine protein phosphatase PrpC
MGTYLAQPITTKNTAGDSNALFTYGLATMQGWRERNEDAHLAKLDIDGNQTSLFAVFDGHGGSMIA